MPELDGYKVRLEGPGISVERPVTEDLAKQITLVLLGGGSSIQPSFATPVTAMAGGVASRVEERPPMSIREYLSAHKANKLSKVIVGIGCFLKEYETKPTFGRDELISAFEAAGEPVPKNIPRDLGKTVQAGWIAEKVGAPGQFYVTASGMEAVAGNFENATRTVRLRTPRPRKVAPQQAALAEVEAAETDERESEEKADS